MMLKIYLRSWFKGQLVDKDEFGHAYYRLRNYRGPWRLEPRWVIYRGQAHASKIPANWHAWLHHVRKLPEFGKKLRYPWIKKHRPTMTGTPFAFQPHLSLSIQKKFYPYHVWKPHSSSL